VQAALESALTELVLGPDLDLRRPEVLNAWLSRHGVAPDDAQAIEASGGERFLVYRRMVRRTLREALELAIPRTMARLGARFDHYFDRFLAERGPRTHFLRVVTQEFLDWCKPQWLLDAAVPPYIADLARHESLQIEVASLPIEQLERAVYELELDRALRLTEAMRLVQYGYKVHELSESLDDRSEPVRADTELLVYRSPEHEVRYLELSKLAYAIVDRLLRGRTLRQALREACEDADQPLDASVLEGSARLLSDLAERGVLLGAVR
jgi:hypothetical protein